MLCVFVWLLLLLLPLLLSLLSLSFTFSLSLVFNVMFVLLLLFSVFFFLLFYPFPILFCFVFAYKIGMLGARNVFFREKNLVLSILSVISHIYPFYGEPLRNCLAPIVCTFYLKCQFFYAMQYSFMLWSTLNGLCICM